MQFKDWKKTNKTLRISKPVVTQAKDTELASLGLTCTRINHPLFQMVTVSVHFLEHIFQCISCTSNWVFCINVLIFNTSSQQYYLTIFAVIFSEVNHETLNILKYVRPGGGFVPKFPVFGKVEVNGLNEEPLFTYLKVLFDVLFT